MRTLARAGFIVPQRNRLGHYNFSFQDVVLLRTAKSLRRARVPHQRMERALGCLKQKLPEDQPLSSYQIEAHGDRIVVSDGERAWDIESNQLEIEFPRPRAVVRSLDSRMTTTSEAEEWYQRGIELEALSIDEAKAAYQQAVELDPAHADAQVNLGRLLHQQHRVTEAAERYRLALLYAPHATAAFNLGLALEDLGHPREAVKAYETALQLNPTLADAHYNLAGIFHAAGDPMAAIRHLKNYRALRRP
ncbi:MAG: tetratricopeptide repeat protein [Gemmatimonadota bacterium]